VAATFFARSRGRHNVGTTQRRHRVQDHLEWPRWQRGECRCEWRAAADRGICSSMPLAREHHGDEHLEPLHASASTAVFVMV
jgi:hypothetical protein